MTDEIKKNSKEQRLLAMVFGLISGLGYNNGSSFQNVKVTRLGVYRLVVHDLNTDQLGKAVTYSLTFDPANRRGLLFEKFLELVTIQLVGVNRTNKQFPDYRECQIELTLKDPKTMLKIITIYTLKTSSGLTRMGLPWMDKTVQMSTEQATEVLNILVKDINLAV